MRGRERERHGSESEPRGCGRGSSVSSRTAFVSPVWKVEVTFCGSETCVQPPFRAHLCPVCLGKGESRRVPIGLGETRPHSTERLNGSSQERKRPGRRPGPHSALPADVYYYRCVSIFHDLSSSRHLIMHVTKAADGLLERNAGTVLEPFLGFGSEAWHLLALS